jgi:peptidoglycan/LPS O-acetylase OafA/YrhL
MTIAIPDAIGQTSIFMALLVITLIVSTRKREEGPSLSVSTTTELKGFAILAIVLAHIGYYLAEDHRFLFPLSVLAGVGVDLFLVLSGYGLAHSMMRKQPTLLEFYVRRTSRIFVPLWLVLGAILTIDAFGLHLIYPLKTILQGIIGIFPKANLYESMNAPFWYLSLLLLYYFLFPIFFSKRTPVFSALILAGIAYKITHLESLPVDIGVLGSYHGHLLGFPFGIVLFAVLEEPFPELQHIWNRFKLFFSKKDLFVQGVRIALLLFFTSLVCYFAIHSGVGKGVSREQTISLSTVLFLIILFAIKPFEQRFLYWVGNYSYEIYLIHWPLLYRYDVLYLLLPAGIVTFLYLWIFMGLSALIQRGSAQILKKLRLT